MLLKSNLVQKLILFSIILVAAATLRLLHIGAEDFWYDEMILLHFVKNPSWQGIFWDNSPFLYNFIYKIWVQQFGDSESMARFLPAFFSTAGVGLYAWINRNDLPKALRLGILAGLSVMSITYAREARAYAMFEFFSILNTFAFLNFLKQPDRLSRRDYYLSLLPLALSHYFAVIPILIQAVFLRRFSGRGRWGFRVSVALAGLLGLVFLLNVRPESMSWYFVLGDIKDWSWSPVEVYFRLAFSSWAVLAVLAYFLARGLYFWQGQQIQNRYFIVMLTVPIFGLCLISFISGASVMIPRYFIFLTPVLILFLEQQLSSRFQIVRWNMAVYALLTVLIAYSIPSIYVLKKSPWSAAADLVSVRQQPVVLTPLSLGIATPYFDRKNIQVQKWNPNKIGSQKIADAISQGKSVWIVDTFLASHRYIGALSEAMKERGYRMESYILAKETNDPIVLMNIEKENHAPQHTDKPL